MNIIKFLDDFNIEYVTSGEYARKGWANINCPFCPPGKRPFRLGIKLDDGRCSCWQCRGKSIFKVIRTLAKCDWDETKRIFKQYGGKSSILLPSPLKKKVARCSLPVGSDLLRTFHDEYLRERKFDPELLEKVYGLEGTGRFAYMKNGEESVDYKYRIIAPIAFEGRLVSFQGRDITGTQKLRYKACPSELEVIDHKDIVYGYDLAEGDSVGIVEGITDAWRFGPGTVATFGTGFKLEQLNVLLRRYKRFFVIYDPEPAAQEVAEELLCMIEVAGRSGEIVITDHDCDPGDLEQSEADHIMRELRLKGWK